MGSRVDSNRSRGLRVGAEQVLQPNRCAHVVELVLLGLGAVDQAPAAAVLDPELAVTTIFDPLDPAQDPSVDLAVVVHRIGVDPDQSAGLDLLQGLDRERSKAPADLPALEALPLVVVHQRRMLPGRNRRQLGDCCLLHHALLSYGIESIESFLRMSTLLREPKTTLSKGGLCYFCKMCCTLPTSPVSSLTLIPRGCTALLVSKSCTNPWVSFPVRWSAFCTMAT